MKLTIIFLCLFILYLALSLPDIPYLLFSVFVLVKKKKKLVLPLCFLIYRGCVFFQCSSTPNYRHHFCKKKKKLPFSYFLLFCNYIFYYIVNMYTWWMYLGLNVNDVYNTDQNNIVIQTWRSNQCWLVCNQTSLIRKKKIIIIKLWNTDALNQLLQHLIPVWIQFSKIDLM